MSFAHITHPPPRTVGATTRTTPLPPLRTIRQVVKAHNDAGLGWLYRELADHLRRVGPSTLTTQEIADFVGGMSADTTKAKLAILVDEGLLKRVRKGRGAYTYRLPDPVTVEFAPAKSPHEKVNSPHEGEKTPHEGEKTPPLLNDMNESMSEGLYILSDGDGLEGESEHRRLIRTMDFKTPHTLGKALLDLTDKCVDVEGSLEEIHRLVHLDKTHAAANPYAYLYNSLTNWLERQQDNQHPRPPKSKPASKFAVPDGTSETPAPVQATEPLPPGGPMVYPDPAIVIPDEEPDTDEADPSPDTGDTPAPPESDEAQQVRRILRQHMGTSYDDLLLHRAHIAVTDDTLTITAADAASADQLKGRWSRFIRTYAVDALGRSVDVEVRS